VSTTGETGMTARAASTGSPSPSASPTRPVPTMAASSSPAGSPTASTAGAARPAAVSVNRGRRVKLTVSRIDPWSAMKMSFLLSVALGIAMVVMVAVLWTILAGMGVFDQIDSMITQVLAGATTKPVSIQDYVGFGRVVSLSVVIAVLDVVIMTAIATLGAFLYNVCSALVGGLQLTLTDD
jgi:hypothetical protein